jgi:hypothetical protein
MWCQMRGLRAAQRGIVAAATLAGVAFAGAANALTLAEQWNGTTWRVRSTPSPR